MASASTSTSLQSQHDALIQSFSSPQADLKSIGTQLTKLKIALSQSGLLIPTPEAKKDVKGLALARDVLEVGAFWSIKTKDVKSFDRYTDLLKVFYNDLSSSLPASENQQPLLGLSLLRLLSSNAIASFHTLLETLPSDLVQNSPYLQHPILLERWLMEGSYSKVWRSRDQVPREEYKFFVDGLMSTIRREIASCEEKAYDSLPQADASTLLFFDNTQQMSDFANERGWQINPTTKVVHFRPQNLSAVSGSTVGGEAAAAAAVGDQIPKRATIASNLSFARELESIV